MSVNYIKKIYKDNLPIWVKQRDAIAGQDEIKDKGREYLPALNGQDTKLYDAYLSRAQYTNFSGRTLEIVLGQLFRKPVAVSEEINQDILDNIDLTGTSFSEFSVQLARETTIINWTGLLLDFNEKLDRPYLTLHKAEEIINWKYKIVNGVTKLSLVVIEGMTEVPDQKYEETMQKSWRELSLDGEGLYIVNDYTKNDKDEIIPGNEFKPLKNGNRLDYIPFYFVNTSGDSKLPAKPVLYDFINTNLGHYVNSADFENMLHWTGAKTLVTVGFGEGTIPIGGSFDLSKDGEAFFLEASSDSGLAEELKHKEETMAALGSSIITGSGKYVASAKTAQISASGEYATLGQIAQMLSDTMSKIMTDLHNWDTGKDAKIVVTYNTDYDTSGTNPQLLTIISAMKKDKQISEHTFNYNLNRFEIYERGWNLAKETEAIKKDAEKKKEISIVEKPLPKIAPIEIEVEPSE